MITATGCSDTLLLRAVPGIPRVRRGDDLAAVVLGAIAGAGIGLADGDVIAVVSKIVSKAEGRHVDLSTVNPGAEAFALATEIEKDARLVELVLGESAAVSRKAPGVLVVRHRLGFVCANAGIDASNATPEDAPAGSGPWVLLLPSDPDASAERIRVRLREATGARIGVVVTDSHGRPFRLGTVGVALGVAGLPPLWDRRGERDLSGYELEHTVTAFGDQVAAAADLVAGQAAEARPVVLVRGLAFEPGPSSAAALVRPAAEDLYA